MVAVENIEAANQPLVGTPEDREIMIVLDVMMRVQLLQEELQSRREEAGEFTRADLVIPKLRIGVVERS